MPGSLAPEPVFSAVVASFSLSPLGHSGEVPANVVPEGLALACPWDSSGKVPETGWGQGRGRRRPSQAFEQAHFPGSLGLGPQ